MTTPVKPSHLAYKYSDVQAVLTSLVQKPYADVAELIELFKKGLPVNVNMQQPSVEAPPAPEASPEAPSEVVSE